MKETYTVQEAMERLGLKSRGTFYRWERKHPQAFVVLKQTKGVKQKKGQQFHYDKAALDRFAKTREQSNQEKP